MHKLSRRNAGGTEREACRRLVQMPPLFVRRSLSRLGLQRRSLVRPRTQKRSRSFGLRGDVDVLRGWLSWTDPGCSKLSFRREIGAGGGRHDFVELSASCSETRALGEL